MSSAATVLQSHQLVHHIFAHQHGIHLDMRPLVSVEDPWKQLRRANKTRNGRVIKEMVAPLHDALTAWYNEWGHARIVKLFACAPQMQLRVLAHALWSGNLSVLTVLPVEMLRAVASDMVDLAAFHGDTSVLKYLHDVVGLDVSTPGAMYNAAQHGHLDVIRYLLELNHDTDVDMAAQAAMRGGHFKATEFFHVHCAAYNLNHAFVLAIHREDLVVAQLVLDLAGKDELEWPFAMNPAAANGHVRTLEWLHQRGFACSPDAMNYAAKGGHLDVIQWLHANRSEGCTELAMHRAAVNGHLDVVEWLFTNRHEGCTTATLESTARNGHWHVVRFLIAHDIGTDNTQVALKVALNMKDAPADVVAMLEAAIESRDPQRKKRCIQQDP